MILASTCARLTKQQEMELLSSEPVADDLIKRLRDEVIAEGAAQRMRRGYPFGFGSSQMFCFAAISLHFSIAWSRPAASPAEERSAARVAYP